MFWIIKKNFFMQEKAAYENKDDIRHGMHHSGILHLDALHAIHKKGMATLRLVLLLSLRRSAMWAGTSSFSVPLKVKKFGSLIATFQWLSSIQDGEVQQGC